nr:MAG TPA: hypothetical protein [Caudoviricetes sp.]
MVVYVVIAFMRMIEANYCVKRWAQLWLRTKTYSISFYF